jgi:hypothetical protein
VEARTPKPEGSGGDPKNSMTLGEHITSIIMMDYGNNKQHLKNNVLSQINGSPEDTCKHSVAQILQKCSVLKSIFKNT